MEVVILKEYSSSNEITVSIFFYHDIIIETLILYTYVMVIFIVNVLHLMRRKRHRVQYKMA
ncbi:hypothetical protein SCO01_19840 [Staphylococcus cohnii subsp. cohnii]|nr:hypothetical protein SCO01_19840 [Staphylococcus cohnii subsp. cohnii]